MEMANGALGQGGRGGAVSDRAHQGGPVHRQSARASAVHWPKPLATMLRMTAQT